ncbi:MAG: hypothetical protein HY591_07095 [Candidatus Omnitrophica bacterium]|nr:hypothetical protein [Candidatus Omnitrophota bacterium]
MPRWTAVLVMGFLALGGCGYTTGSLLPSNYRTISIEPFGNKVGYLDENNRGLYTPLLENKVHDAVVRRFQMDGHLKVAKSGRTDLVLKGDLIRFEREDVRLNDNQGVDQYRVRVTVALKLIDPAGGGEEWSEPSFSGEAAYYTSGPLAKPESTAMEEALTDLSRRIVERTIENW